MAIPGISPLDDWHADLDTRPRPRRIDHLSALLPHLRTRAPRSRAASDLGQASSPTPRTTSPRSTCSIVLPRPHCATPGYERYEVSNFAATGQACRHNLAYWRQEPWLAAGPSASAHFAGHRWKNQPRLETYLSNSDAGLPPIQDHEPPDPGRALAERLMTGLRLAEGVPGPEMLERATTLGGDQAEQLARVIDRAAEHGWLRPDTGSSSDRWVLSDAGLLVADGIASDCISAVS